jgi:hypothetical protein
MCRALSSRVRDRFDAITEQLSRVRLVAPPERRLSAWGGGGAYRPTSSKNSLATLGLESGDPNDGTWPADPNHLAGSGGVI